MIKDKEAGRLPYRKRVITIDSLVSRRIELKRIRETDVRFQREMEEVLGGGLERDIQELGFNKERR